MSNSFCKKIDKEQLVEKYVAGRLSGLLLTEFEKHIAGCKKHSKEVFLEKLINKGIAAYARNEMKLRLRQRIQKGRENRYFILKIAAILFIVTISPLILYYHYHVEQAGKIAEKDLVKKEIKKIAPAGSIENRQPSLKVRQEVRIPKGMEEIPKKKTEVKEIPVSREKTLPAPLQSVTGSMPGQAKESKAATLSLREREQVMRKGQSIKGGTPSKQAGEAGSDKKRSERKMSTVSVDRAPMETAESSLDYAAEVKSEDQPESLLSHQLLLHEPEINDCFNRYKDLIANDSLEMTVKIIILSNGSVGSVKIIDNTVSIDKINDCIINTVLGWRFSPQDKQVQIKKKFIYRKDAPIEVQ